MSPEGFASAAPRPQAATERPLTGLIQQLQGLGASVAGAPSQVSVTGITHDSRQVRPGDVYAALPGAHAHGAQFAAAAIAAGAVAVLTDPAGARLVGPLTVPVLSVPEVRATLGAVAAWVYGRPTDSLTLIGVTGTNGKTTTTYLVDAGLRAAGRHTGLIGTVETRIGDDVLPSVRTTPEATDLQALFAVMHQHGVTAAAMEVSSHALALRRVDGIRFTVSVFTNLSQDHLDFHPSMEDYFQAKARLFTAPFTDTSVVNVDDPAGRRLTDLIHVQKDAVRLVTYSAEASPADWRAVDVVADARGSRFTAVGPDGSRTPVRTRLPGGFNVPNALAALAALVTAGIPADTAATGFATLPGVPGRMELVDVGQPFLALVDYAHTPVAVSRLLAAARSLTDTGRVIVVLGCGGDRDRAKRPLMGRAAAEHADLAVFTSDNPRSEDPDAIIAAMLTGATGDIPGRIQVEPDRRLAIEYAVNRARPGDVVVVAGKGHERGQEFADHTVAFDDRLALRAALGQLVQPGSVA